MTRPFGSASRSVWTCRTKSWTTWPNCSSTFTRRPSKRWTAKDTPRRRSCSVLFPRQRGKHETTPGQYVGCRPRTQGGAQKLGVQFSGTAADIEELIAYKGSRVWGHLLRQLRRRQSPQSPGARCSSSRLSPTTVSRTFSFLAVIDWARPDHPSEGTASLRSESVKRVRRSSSRVGLSPPLPPR